MKTATNSFSNTKPIIHLTEAENTWHTISLLIQLLLRKIGQDHHNSDTSNFTVDSLLITVDRETISKTCH